MTIAPAAGPVAKLGIVSARRWGGGGEAKRGRVTGSSERREERERQQRRQAGRQKGQDRTVAREERERRRKQERASSGVEVNEALHGMKAAPGPRVRDARRPTDHRRPTRPTDLPCLASPPVLAPSSIFTAAASPYLPALLLRGRVALG